MTLRLDDTALAGTSAGHSGYPDEAVNEADVVRILMTAEDTYTDGDNVEPLRVAVELAHAHGVGEAMAVSAAERLSDLEAEQQPLTFTDVPRAETEELQAALSREAAVEILSRCLGLSSDTRFQSDILKEFHFHNFAYCQRSRFSAEKTSTLISIFNRVHNNVIVQGKLLAVSRKADARVMFNKLVDRHSQQLPPYRVGVFSRDEAAAIKAYADKTFFQHYKMYCFAYIQREVLEVRSAFARVVPKLPEVVEFKTWHEVDPRQLPDLQDLFSNRDSDVDAKLEATTYPSLSQALEQTRAPSPFADERETAVAAAIDEVMQGHLANLDARLTLPTKK
jgi:hypothetical protein